MDNYIDFFNDFHFKRQQIGRITLRVVCMTDNLVRATIITADGEVQFVRRSNFNALVIILLH